MSKQGKYQTMPAAPKPEKRKSKSRLLLSLLMSLTSMILCTSMLMSTTLAWFTDTVTVTGNQITTGKLEVAVSLLTDANTAVPLTDNGTQKVFDSTVKWKPGTMQIRNLRIENKGDLEIRYIMNLIRELDEDAVSQAFDVYIYENGAQYGTWFDSNDAAVKKIMNQQDGWKRIGSLKEFFGSSSVNQILPAEKTQDIAIAIYLPSNAGNELGGKKLTLSLKLDAYQSDIPDEEITTTTVYVDSIEDVTDALKDAAAAGAGDTIVKLSKDLDMSNTTWTPIEVDGYHGAGVVTFDGNGHTITGLTAPLFEGGFAGSSGIVIRNVTIADSNITSTHSTGAGAFIEYVDSMTTVTLENCHLENSTVTSVEEDVRVGGLIGYTTGYNVANDGPVDTYVTVNNCSVENCTINAPGSAGGIIGHSGANPATFTTVSNCTVKNCKINSNDTGDWRVGVVIGTVNVGEQNDISNITESGNTLTQTGKTAPEGQSSLYGRFVPGETGKLTIDGVAITN